jgi:Leucine-rich repeat (LRR) protein
VSISSSQYAQYVRQVDLGYGSLPCSVGDIVLYTENLVGLLSSSLRQFPNLKAIDFSGPPLTSLPYDKMKASIDPILMALCYVPLPNLTELEIRLPMTNNFAPLFAEKISILRIPIEQTLNRLHHLGLHVYAQTNQQSCATHLLRIVELSNSLTSLSLSSTNFLSIDSLILSSKVCLRVLSLQKVKISSQNLVDILEQSIESMVYIELRQLQIEPGSPKEILSAMDSLFCLYDLDICEGGTSRKTERFHSTQTQSFTAEHVQEPGLFSLVYDASQNPRKEAKSKRTMARDFSH